MNKFLLQILFLGFVLRVAYLDKFPIGFYSDEAVFGYNAYLLLQTGRDEYNRFWPVSLESFGDWKPPLQAWLAIPSIFIFGLNEFAVRLPSAILGTATIAIIYFLAKELFPKKLTVDSWQLNVGEIASLLLAISPWHIFMSRIAMLVAVEVFFVSAGVLFLLKGLKNSKFWLPAALNFVGAIYSYYGSRITVPLILVSFSVIFFRKIWPEWKMLILSSIFGAILLLPLVFSAFKNPLFLTGRARTTSVFFNDNVRLQLWDAHTKAGLKKIPPLISRFFDNKLYYYTKDILERYWSHFSPQFLFFSGDSHPPFKIPRLGYLHLIDLPFFLIGLWMLRRRAEKDRKAKFLILYLLLSPFVAGLTFLTPAANRSFNLVIPWTLITAFGVSKLMAVIPANHVIPARFAEASAWLRRSATPRRARRAKAGIYLNRFLVKRFDRLLEFLESEIPRNRRSERPLSRRHELTAEGPGMTIGIVFLYLASLFLFFYSYVYLIPQELPHHWHYGRKELVNKLKPLLTEYNKIYLTNKGGPPYIFLSFYLPIQPDDFYKSIKRNPIINDLGWGHTDKILNVEIPREFDWKEVPKDSQALYIGFENEIPENEVQILDRIYYPNGKIAYVIAKL